MLNKDTYPNLCFLVQANPELDFGVEEADSYLQDAQNDPEVVAGILLEAEEEARQYLSRVGTRLVDYLEPDSDVVITGIRPGGPGWLQTRTMLGLFNYLISAHRMPHWDFNPRKFPRLWYEADLISNGTTWYLGVLGMADFGTYGLERGKILSQYRAAEAGCTYFHKQGLSLGEEIQCMLLGEPNRSRELQEEYHPGRLNRKLTRQEKDLTQYFGFVQQVVHSLKELEEMKLIGFELGGPSYSLILRNDWSTIPTTTGPHCTSAQKH